MSVVGTVRSVHRYPVKSMVGETLDAAHIGEGGVPGDRIWAARNLEVGEQQGARKLPGLLGLTASLPEGGDTREPVPVVGFPDGTTLPANVPEASERVSAYVGKRVELVPLRPASDTAHYRNGRMGLDAAALRTELGVVPGETAPEVSSLGFRKLLELGIYATPPGTYFDAFPLHVLTTASLRYVAHQSANPNVDPARYRPNVVIDTGDTEALLEPGWEGATLELGDCRIRIECRTIRCSIPGRAQAIDGIDADKSVVRAVAEHADRHLGAYATIEQPGLVRVGDPVRLVPHRQTPLARGLQRTSQTVLRSVVRRLLRG